MIRSDVEKKRGQPITTATTKTTTRARAADVEMFSGQDYQMR